MPSHAGTLTDSQKPLILFIKTLKWRARSIMLPLVVRLSAMQACGGGTS